MVLTEDWLWTCAIAGCTPDWFSTEWVLIKLSQIYSHHIVKLPELLPEMIQCDWQKAKYQPDVVALYSVLSVPVLPIALFS